MSQKVLLDSNIIIYITNPEPEYRFIRHYLKQFELSASKVSKIEVLGFHKLNAVEKVEYELFFNAIPLYPINDPIIQKATALRQTKKMSLGDAIILATAIIYELPLMTRNAKDFNWIDGLQLINPFENTPT